MSPEGFYADWMRVGQRSDLLSPTQEALCAVLEAWGARFSDNPIVLGLTGRRALQAPKVFNVDGSTLVGGHARAHWGKTRLPVCNALSDRALRLIEVNGVLHRPSVPGVQALSLWNLLAALTDQPTRASDQFLQCR